MKLVEWEKKSLDFPHKDCSTSVRTLKSVQRSSWNQELQRHRKGLSVFEIKLSIFFFSSGTNWTICNRQATFNGRHLIISLFGILFFFENASSFSSLLFLRLILSSLYRNCCLIFFFICTNVLKWIYMNCLKLVCHAFNDKINFMLLFISSWEVLLLKEKN